jgi:hypothetical protein
VATGRTAEAVTADLPAALGELERRALSTVTAGFRQ